MQELDPGNAETLSRLDWNDVRIFVAVAETGSLSRAGRILGMSQPTIGRRMEELEKNLGARLMSRTPRGVVLTAVGEAMHRHAAGMARLGESIVRDITGKDQDAAGEVVLAAPDDVANYLLAPHLGDFHAAHPEINLVLDCGPWPGASDPEPDLTLDYREETPPDRTSVPIAHVHYAYFASQAYLTTYGAPKRITEIMHHRTVRNSASHEQQTAGDPKGRAMRQLVNATLVTNSSAALVEAVRGGAGIGSLPTALCQAFPDLRMIDLEPAARPTLWLRHHASVVERERVQRVVEWLTRVFDPESRPWYRPEFVHPRHFSRTAPLAVPAPRTGDKGRRTA